MKTLAALLLTSILSYQGAKAQQPTLKNAMEELAKKTITNYEYKQDNQYGVAYFLKTKDKSSDTIQLNVMVRDLDDTKTYSQGDVIRITSIKNNKITLLYRSYKNNTTIRYEERGDTTTLKNYLLENYKEFLRSKQ